MDYNIPGYVSTMLVYNSTVFTAYTNGEIQATPLPNNWFKPYRKDIKTYTFQLQSDEKYINDMLGYKGALYVTTPNQLHCFKLENDKLIKEEQYLKKIVECTKIKIDYKSKLLFAVSEDRGLVVINISNPFSPKYICDISLDNYFGEGNNVISDMDLCENIIFLALRGKGILRIDYYNKEIKDSLWYSTVEKIKLQDPQDVKYNKNNLHLYIADAVEGLIVLNTLDNSIIDTFKLPNDDFPVKLIINGKNCIVQGNNGLYMYQVNERKISTILNYKVGEVIKYFNKIIFYKNRKLNLIVFGNKVDNDNEEMFSKVYKYYKNELSVVKG
ncbi:hypothetical protein [Psychrobacillus soli]|uniref:Uncharacterized protein n=1 Tax=Psychrobacillus soli TaxID=1543965 RepID=A0A544TB80_9BACI|nr:hypothetical protein [Psychrobacillus soli]TQR14727.1 hypothetical protein FG383_10420 [Psychrobacillus soli]